MLVSLYVRVMNNFYTHRKTIRLRAAIGDAAFWVPPRLWAYAAENQPDGIFKDYSATEIALLIGYLGDAKEMLKALLEARYMDSDPLRVHDWEEHNGYHSTFAKRAKTAATARWANNSVSPAPSVQDSTRKERKGKEASIAASNASSTKLESEGNSKSQTVTLESRQVSKVDPIQEIQKLNDALSKLSGRESRLNPDTERIFFGYRNAGYTVDDLAVVLRWIKWRNNQQEDFQFHIQMGARSLLEDLAKFQERLGEAKAWDRNRPKPPTPRETAMRELRPVVCEQDGPDNIKTAADLIPEVMQTLSASVRR